MSIVRSSFRAAAYVLTLDEKIKVTCTMDEYGVVYYLDHHEGHVRCRFPAITC